MIDAQISNCIRVRLPQPLILAQYGTTIVTMPAYACIKCFTVFEPCVGPLAVGWVDRMGRIANQSRLVQVSPGPALDSYHGVGRVGEKIFDQIVYLVNNHRKSIPKQGQQSLRGLEGLVRYLPFQMNMSRARET